MSKLYFRVRTIDFTQKEERKREKVTLEVKECSRRKAQKLSRNNFAKKPTRLQ